MPERYACKTISYRTIKVLRHIALWVLSITQKKEAPNMDIPLIDP
jgi:hypothetical protein